MSETDRIIAELREQLRVVALAKTELEIKVQNIQTRLGLIESLSSNGRIATSNPSKDLLRFED